MPLGHKPAQWSSLVHVISRSNDQPCEELVPVRVTLTTLFIDSKVTEMSKPTPLGDTEDEGHVIREAPHDDRSGTMVFELLSVDEPMKIGMLCTATPARFENRPAAQLMHWLSDVSPVSNDHFPAGHGLHCD